MNVKKRLVMEKAHQLFIEKGFQATSVQDILDSSGISKGTFYNYFSSKNELLISIFKAIFQKVEYGRNQLLVGQDPSNIEIFTQQIELQLKTNHANNLIPLFEEVYFSNDDDLKQFLRDGHLRSLHWIYLRFIDIFGEGKKPYLLDCAIMFNGILQHNLKYNAMEQKSYAAIEKIVRYSVNRIVKIVEEVSETGEQLLRPELIDRMLPDCQSLNRDFYLTIHEMIEAVKKTLPPFEEAEPSDEHQLLEFIQDELLHSKHPRKFLIESAILSLRQRGGASSSDEIQKLERMIAAYFSHLEDNG